MSSLRVFGCRAWAYLPPYIRRKMDPRALPATHLGYAEESEGYRALITGRVYVRRDINFDDVEHGSAVLFVGTYPVEHWDSILGIYLCTCCLFCTCVYLICWSRSGHSLLG